MRFGYFRDEVIWLKLQKDYFRLSPSCAILSLQGLSIGFSREYSDKIFDLFSEILTDYLFTVV
jgi:hypothetical protein